MSSPSIVRIDGSRCLAQPRKPVPSYASVSLTHAAPPSERTPLELLALHELDPRHRGTVALARPELQDPRVAALPLLEPWPDLVEELRDDVAVGDVAEDLAARREVPTLRERDQLLRERAERFRLRLRRPMPSCTKSCAASVDSSSF